MRRFKSIILTIMLTLASVGLPVEATTTAVITVNDSNVFLDATNNTYTVRKQTIDSNGNTQVGNVIESGEYNTSTIIESTGELFLSTSEEQAEIGGINGEKIHLSSDINLKINTTNEAGIIAATELTVGDAGSESSELILDVTAGNIAINTPIYNQHAGTVTANGGNAGIAPSSDWESIATTEIGDTVFTADAGSKIIANGINNYGIIYDKVELIGADVEATSIGGMDGLKAFDLYVLRAIEANDDGNNPASTLHAKGKNGGLHATYMNVSESEIYGESEQGVYGIYAESSIEANGAGEQFSNIYGKVNKGTAILVSDDVENWELADRGIISLVNTNIKAEVTDGIGVSTGTFSVNNFLEDVQTTIDIKAQNGYGILAENVDFSISSGADVRNNISIVTEGNLYPEHPGYQYLVAHHQQVGEIEKSAAIRSEAQIQFNLNNSMTDVNISAPKESGSVGVKSYNYMSEEPYYQLVSFTISDTNHVSINAGKGIEAEIVEITNWGNDVSDEEPENAIAMLTIQSSGDAMHAGNSLRLQSYTDQKITANITSEEGNGITAYEEYETYGDFTISDAILNITAKQHAIMAQLATAGSIYNSVVELNSSEKTGLYVQKVEQVDYSSMSILDSVINIDAKDHAIFSEGIDWAMSANNSNELLLNQITATSDEEVMVINGTDYAEISQTELNLTSRKLSPDTGSKSVLAFDRDREYLHFTDRSTLTESYLTPTKKAITTEAYDVYSKVLNMLANENYEWTVLKGEETVDVTVTEEGIALVTPEEKEESNILQRFFQKTRSRKPGEALQITAKRFGENNDEKIYLDDSSTHIISIASYLERPAIYTVTYDGNGHTSGIVPEDLSTYAIGDLVTISNEAPLKEAAIFKGWTYNGVDYQPGETFELEGGNAILTAKWELIEETTTAPEETTTAPEETTTTPEETTTTPEETTTTPEETTTAPEETTTAPEETTTAPEETTTLPEETTTTTPEETTTAPEETTTAPGITTPEDGNTKPGQATLTETGEDYTTAILGGCLLILSMLAFLLHKKVNL